MQSKSRIALRVLWMGISCLGACTLGACARSTAIPVDYNSSVPGFRVYDVKPILIVNGQQTSIELIPNYNKAYAMQFTAFLAKNEFVVDVERGFIKKLQGTLDSTKFIELLQDVVKQLPALTGKAMSGSAEGGVQDRFQVYEFVFADDGTLVGLKPLIDQRDLLRVRTSRPPSVSLSSQVVPQIPDGSGDRPVPGTVQ
jgi:hypothetical protein